MVAVNAASSAPSSVVTIDPVRILDTRTDLGLPGPFVSAVSQKLLVTGSTVPIGATGVLLNVTVVGPTAAGFLSVRPGDASGAATTSSLNFNAGDLIPNSVQVGLPTAGANAGQIDITYNAYGQAGPTTEVLIDVVGYMVAGGAATGPAGPAGAAGPAGTAIAYAQVFSELVPISGGSFSSRPALVASLTSNIAAVTRPAAGVWCLTVAPSIAPQVFSPSGARIRVVVATVGDLTLVSGVAEVRVQRTATTCGSNRLEIRTFVDAAPSSEVGFSVAIV